ncbi:hypothetical protein PENSPDRAFT_683736 [Peniophora sp. CONT]|nr:hypothetical protein PENSPDRAFT_683736 [Peniophora sp. CONT]
MNDFIRTAREHNTFAHIHRKLSNENLCDIFLALASLDTPSIVNPKGWYNQVNGVCHLWREAAVHCAELWARSAGSFPSLRMTDLVIQRAGASLLSLNGHFEDHAGPGYVLTDYQLSLVEMHAARLRSLVHDEYTAWSELFYCLRALPELEMASIWDESGPDEWDECIDAPRLHCLYMNNALIPFNTPSLRYLRVDMDNVYWRSGRDVFNTSEPFIEGCEAIPRVFPTREFIAFLQRSPLLERLIVTNMPLLLAERLPIPSDLYADLPHLRSLHLGGKSWAMGDLWQRLRTPPDVQVFIDTDYLDGETNLDLALREVVQRHLELPAYDSLRLGMTPSYDLLFQTWASEACSTPGLDLLTSLDLTTPISGAAFTLRLPVGTRELLATFIDGEPPMTPSKFSFVKTIEDPFLRFQDNVARDFFSRTNTIMSWLEFPTLAFIDLTDLPYVEHGESGFWGQSSQPDGCLTRLYSSLSALRRREVVLSWSLFIRLSQFRLNNFYMPNDSVRTLTLVNFPCAAFPHGKRYDEEFNEKAWDVLQKFFTRYFISPDRYRDHPVSLRLAESASDMSNMERSEEPPYEHTISGSYEDAVRTVTEKGYQRIAPFMSSFEDLRIHTWP